MMTARLPGFLQRRVSAAVDSLLNSQPGGGVDFSAPRGEEALMPAHSVSWRVFKNPVALFVGGTAAVLLELAEPAVRAGVWQHSSFRTSPLARLQRTGLAAMLTVYGARRSAESMIRRVVQMHDAVRGTTERGVAYTANDPRLLTWVHATAAYGFTAAYDRYVARLHGPDVDRLYREGEPVARLYGADAPPRTRVEMHELFERVGPFLGPSPIVFEFLNIMSTTPALLPGMHWLQRMLVRAAVELLPAWIRTRLGLGPQYGLRRHEAGLVALAGATAERIILPASPAVQSCARLGLPLTYLYSSSKSSQFSQVLENKSQPAYFVIQSDSHL